MATGETSTPTAVPHTFEATSTAWIHELESRKRKPVSPATLHAFRSYVRRLLPLVGPHTPLADIDNGFVRDLVTKLVAENLSAKTIGELVFTTKQILASAVDANGNFLFPRQWNAKFLDLPQVQHQKQPCATKADVETCIKNSRNDQEQLLHALLAGSGLRISEALGIHVRGNEKQTSWDKDSSTISVRSTIYRGKHQNRVKTQAAIRTVDLDPRLNDVIAKFVAENNIQTGQYLFQSRDGGPMNLKTATDRLKNHGIKGFHAFRRFRATRLREVGISEEIIRFWIGHADQTISDRYSKLAEKIDLRKQNFPNRGTKLRLPPKSHPSHRSPDATQRRLALRKLSPCFKSTDDDLDPRFFDPTPVAEIR